MRALASFILNAEWIECGIMDKTPWTKPLGWHENCYMGKVSPLWLQFAPFILRISLTCQIYSLIRKLFPTALLRQHNDNTKLLANGTCGSAVGGIALIMAQLSLLKFDKSICGVNDAFSLIKEKPNDWEGSLLAVQPGYLLPDYRESGFVHGLYITKLLGSKFVGWMAEVVPMK